MDPWMPRVIRKDQENPSDLSLTHYHSTPDIIVASDACSYGIGACILRKLPDGSRKAVTHTSRSLLPA